jgi:acyl transferase domain-containing protein/SAM-dependent methyltransferase
MEIGKDLRSWDDPLRVALVNSYGAAGSNCALICCELPAAQMQDKKLDILGRSLPLPIVLSAASKSSLELNARVFQSYLSKNQSSLDLADVAFTLHRHRKRHKFYLETSTADTGGQNLPELPYLESPKQPKPVVLVLSGQYDTKVALDRKIYECYPAFRSYIDSCDAGVLQLGYSSIRETVFQTSPIPNATSLQCSIFAVQYASARCWIDSGLRPERIIGHSFGELVALAISGALSLMDCLRLVTSRAHSIDTKWGAEKGAMIAVHDTTCNVQILVSRLNSSLKGARIEIACYNAPASTILVGTTADIERAEYFLATTAEFRNIKVQRLSTSHAFHSALTEPILSELENASDNLEWRDPEIPLETCTRDGLTFTRGWNPSTHAREPVYFVDAVQRVEKLLGSCVWLEVGFNSPIIPMIRRACASPKSHYFHAMKTDAGSTSLDFIGHAISDLRRSGIHLSHWAFLGPGRRNYRKVWLPPYQFDRTAFWMENIDRVREAYELASKALPSAENASETASSKLIQIKPHADVKSTVIDFSINPKSERFQALVRGHSLLRQPLCPAPMYMECTVMAIQNLIGNIDSKHLEFENLHFQTPLGLDPAREIDLRLENMVPNQRWKLTISSVFSQNKTNALIHCTGNISLLKRDLSVYTRLVESSIEGVRRSHDTERLKSKRAYGLFSKVMNYLPFFQGIKSLNLLESEAVAVVKFSDNQPYRDDSTVWRRCDTVLIDNFVSVVGLLLNSSGRASDTEIMIANAMDRVTLTAACKTTEPVEWLVYGAFRSTDFAQHLGDVYVCLPTGELVAMMVGVQFIKVDTTKMSKALTSANGGTPKDHSLRSIEIQAESASTMEVDSALTKSSLGAPTPCEDSTDVDIKGMISSYTGLSLDDIPHDGVLFDLGFDSLSIIEFASEVQQAYGTKLTQDQISSMTLDDLGVFLEAKSTNRNVAIKATVNTTIQENRSSNPEKQLPSVSELRVRSTEKPQEEFQENTVYTDALESLAESDSHFENTASQRGYSNYYDQILPILNSLTLAYIIEAFLSMGIDLFAYPPGSIITPVSYMPKYQKLMNRIWEILQAQGIISRHSSVIIRGRASPAIQPSATIYDALVLQFPQYIPDAKVMKLSGEGLARSLRGEQDPLALLFGTPSSSKIMDDYYGTSPMVATLNDQLITFVMLLLQNRRKCGQRSFRILEIGAGTGGTTFGLANKIQAAGLACEYTFTDISGRMISKAREKLTGYPWIKFGNLDLEKEIPDQFRNRFDVTISTNCVHATKNVLTSSRRIWETLVKHGVAVLAEGTERIDWFDLAFGQLDGWWAADDGRDHPIQKESLWTKTFQEAGFEAVGCSGGTTREAKTQQLIVGCKTSPQAGSAPDQSELYQLQTMVYKEADGLPIHADVYIPREVHKSHYPIGTGSQSMGSSCG